VCGEEEMSSNNVIENLFEKYKEWIRWKSCKVPTWCPVDRKKGIVVTGTMICNDNKPPEHMIVGEFVYSGEPIFSKPIVTFYEG